MDPRVLEAMLPCFTEHFGNASSDSHPYGEDAAEAVERARETVAGALGAQPREIVFTSGATEANALAILGATAAQRDKSRRKVITAATEHKAVLDPVRRLEREGWDVVILPVGADGLLDLDALAKELDERTALVSVMHGNNETGVLQDIAAIGALCEAAGAVFHTDATQTAGKLPLDLGAMPVGLLSCSAHKVYGPKGVGALYVRKSRPRVRLEPLVTGGGQERGLRGGTLNTPGIVGFAKALELAVRGREAERVRVAALRDQLRDRLFAELDELRENGAGAPRMAHSLSVTFRYVDATALMNHLREVIAVSSGSACSSRDPEPSHVLLAMGLTAEEARSTLRFGLSRFTTDDDVETAAGALIAAARELRAHSPLYSMR